MKMRIAKDKVTYCSICSEVKEPAQPEVPEGAMEVPEPEEWKGVDGIQIWDANDKSSYAWPKTSICTKCVSNLVRGMGIINANKLSGVELE